MTIREGIIALFPGLPDCGCTLVDHKSPAGIFSAVHHLKNLIGMTGGIHSFSGGIKSAQDALSGAYSFFSYQEVLARLVNTMVTFISGCAGGLVAPAIAIGAGIGSLFGHLMIGIDIKIFILSGMVAFLSPVLGMPFTAAMKQHKAPWGKRNYKEHSVRL